MFHTLYSELKQLADPKKAEKMSAYMRDQFLYLGVPAPERKKIQQSFFKTAKNQTVDWNFIKACWQSPYRELQYVAMDYLAMMKHQLTPKDVENIKHLAIDKSWWDTIDGLDIIVGAIALRYPEVEKTLLDWSLSDNMWLRRLAIDHQLLRKEKTNTTLLATIIQNNLGSDEFFINKAIGWALRDFSKTNPDWVRQFINDHQEQLAKLSIKEASKYL